MTILAIDTSTDYLSLAIMRDGKVIARFHRKCAMRHSSTLIPMIDKLLKKARAKLRSIDCFCLSIGPGSFTGLRVGVAAVKGFALALNKPVVAVPTYDAIANNIFTQKRMAGNGKEIAVIGDAKKEKIYAAIYRQDNGRFKNAGGYLLLKPSNFVKMIKRPTIFAGDGINVCGGLLKDKIRLPERLWYPRAGIIAKLGLEKLRRGKTVNPDNLAPLYIYSRECSITGI